MEQNWQVLVIIQFGHESHTLTLAEILKIDQFLTFVFNRCKTVKVSRND